MTNKPKHFIAILERGQEGLGWTIARLPVDPHQAWSTMLRLRVQGQAVARNGTLISFRTSLFPVPGEPGHYPLLVNNRLQKQAGLSIGSLAEFHLEPDLEPRPAELSEELALLLEEESGLRPFYDSLSESTRREIGKWVTAVKSDASRLRRAEQMAERLLGAMEGEHALPPIIAVAFQTRPKAKTGWAKMTETQRRQ